LATRKHDCQWRDTAAKLQEQLAERDAQLAALSARMNDLEHKMALANRQILGPKSERMPMPEQEAKKREGKKPKWWRAGRCRARVRAAFERDARSFATGQVASRGVTILSTVKPEAKAVFHRWGRSSAARSAG
jgi:hypothetical protein